MKSRLSIVLSLVVLASMLFAACAPATATPAPAQATATTAPAGPTATTAAAQPTATTAAAQPTATTAAAQPTATTAAAQPTATSAPATTRTGGWLDHIVFTAIADAPSAVAQLQAGAIDMYPVTVSDPNVFTTVKGDANLTYSNVYGSNYQLLFNTVQCTDKNILNPFTDQAIREAMNWAVDRNYVAQEISGGLAVPKYTALDTSFPDAARFAGQLGAIATLYAFNMDKAKAVVNAEMPKLGATLGSDGKWQFSGKPVTIIGLIRTEDSRKQIGEYFAKQLESLGFTVDQQEKVRKEAAPIWQGDPTTCKFGYYTAGWINTAIIRDEGLNFAEFNSGEVQNIPLFLKFQPSKELAAAEDALLTNNFTSMDQRAQLFQTALTDSMKESWWGVWVIDSISFEPYKKTISVASDLGAGIAGSQVYPETLRLAGQEGGTVKIAQSGVLVQAWNPINGSNWTDDQMVINATMDRGLVSNPYTGLAMPKLVQSATVVAKTGLPIAKTLDWVNLSFQDSITVPDDAWADWDATKQTFITAKDRAAADPKYKQTANVTSTVTYIPNLFDTKWHDGSNLSPADFVMGMIMAFDPGKKESKIYDEGYATTVQTLLSHFKGVKILSTSPLTIQTWDDTYALDAENSVSTWYPSIPTYSYGTGAWHNIYLGILGETDGKMAFSLDKSTSKKVDETSVVAGPTLDVQNGYLQTLVTSGDIPYAPTLSTYITKDDATARYKNLEAFYTAHKNLAIGTGPYFVDQVDSVAGSVTLSYFPDYKFPADQFSGLGEPEVATVSVDGPTTLAAGDTASFNVSVNFGTQPYPSKDIDKVSYTLFDASGATVDSGDAKMAAEGQYTVDLSADVTGKLTAGSSTLNIAVASKTVGMPSFATYQFVVTK